MPVKALSEVSPAGKTATRMAFCLRDKIRSGNPIQQQIRIGR